MGRAGASVAINYVNQAASAEALANELEAEGNRALAVEADVRDEVEVRRMMERVVEAFGTVDILVANAGVQADAPFLEMSREAWDEVIEVNLTGAFLCAREVAKEFMRRGLKPEISRAVGKIIFTSSVHQTIPWARHVNYAASKGGLMQLMRSCAQELARHKIRVNGIAPGAIKTPINESAWATKEAEQRLVDLIPYGRVGEPEDVANVAVWLASDESDYVHGSTLFVDGGMMLFPGFATGSG